MLSNALQKLNFFVFQKVSAATNAGAGGGGGGNGFFDDIKTNSLAGQAPDASGRFSSLSDIMFFAINLVFAVGLGLALIFVIVGGIKYITSQGDEGKATEARNTITNAVIGAVVIIGFRVILQIVLNLLGWKDVATPIK